MFGGEQSSAPDAQTRGSVDLARTDEQKPVLATRMDMCVCGGRTNERVMNE